jgi:hypothetical protein
MTSSTRKRGDELDLGALLDRRQRLGEAGDHDDVARAADQRAHQLGAVGDPHDVGLEAELLEEALVRHDPLQRGAGGRGGTEDIDGLGLRQRVRCRASRRRQEPAKPGSAELEGVAAGARGGHGAAAQAVAGSRLASRL